MSLNKLLFLLLTTVRSFLFIVIDSKPQPKSVFSVLPKAPHFSVLTI